MDERRKIGKQRKKKEEGVSRKIPAEHWAVSV